MFYLSLLFVLIVLTLMPSPSVAPGRRPQMIEHVYCNLMYGEELNSVQEVDRLAIAQAFNIGQNGSLCMTTCRIVSRGNVKHMDAVTSPDYIPCAPRAQYCYKGNCNKMKEISQLMRKDLKPTTSDGKGNGITNDSKVNQKKI